MSIKTKSFTALGAFLVLIGILVIAVGGYFSALLRDGLGPDSVRSHGLIAAQRFLEGFVGPVIIGACVVALGVVCLFRAARIRRTTLGMQNVGT
jgi:hypothetical protein